MAKLETLLNEFQFLIGTVLQYSVNGLEELYLDLVSIPHRYGITIKVYRKNERYMDDIVSIPHRYGITKNTKEKRNETKNNNKKVSIPHRYGITLHWTNGDLLDNRFQFLIGTVLHET